MEPNPSLTHTVPGLWLERAREKERDSEQEKRKRKRRQKQRRKGDGRALDCKVQAGHL